MPHTVPGGEDTMPEAVVYSVSQVNRHIHDMLRRDTVLTSIRVRGEVSNLKYHSSGHIYFSLKDAGGVLSCVMFRSDAASLQFHMQNGMEVEAAGHVEVYEAYGQYQLYVRRVSQGGIGALYERFEALKTELEEMGMFAPEYKKPIPRFPKVIGVVTAPTGAAVRDIINITRRRNPYAQIVLYPALVQGSEAVPSIVAGIRALEAYGVDVMIVGRGGGSIEDLWAFNERAVAEAVFHCSVPIISAVGHETDTTIIDFVSDLRAPTPSGGAEMATAEIFPFLQALDDLSGRLDGAMNRSLTGWRKDLMRMSDRLQFQSPHHRTQRRREELLRMQETMLRCMMETLKSYREELGEDARTLERGMRQSLTDRRSDLLQIRSLLQPQMDRRLEERRLYLAQDRTVIGLSMDRQLKEARHRVALLATKLDGLSPLRKLSSGYSYVADENGKNIRSVEQVQIGQKIKISVTDGQMNAVVEEIGRA